MNPGRTPLPSPVPIRGLGRGDESSLLDDDTLVAAYRTDLCLHQDRSPRTVTTYGQALTAFRRWLAGVYPDLALPEVQGMHVKAYLLAEAARGIAPITRSSALFGLRSFYEYLRSEELIETNPTAEIKVPGARKLRTEIYTDVEARPDPGLGGEAERVPLAHRLRRVGHAALPRGCGATRSPRCASTRWISGPGASRSSARATSPESYPSLPRSSPSSRTM